MADEAARGLQYEYKANSNLVLQADLRLIDRRGRDEATGEVVSLSGKLLGSRMGDKAVRTKPPAELEAPKAKKSKRAKRDELEKQYTVGRTSSILDESAYDGALEGLYKPKTPETKQTFEILLSFIQEALGDQPHDVLIGAADEVLRTLKNDRMRDKERKKETEELLGASLAEERFALLVNLGKKITDFGHHGGDNDEEENIDETYGINVQFQESDEEEMDIEGPEDDDDDDEEKENGDSGDKYDDHAIKAEGSESSRARDSKSKSLSPNDIDAHFIQRKISKYYDDATVSQKKSKEVLEILQNAENDRECENHLVLLLGYDCFELIKILMKNRDMITYCIRLKMAQNDDEREKIMSDMRKSSHLRRILNQLEGMYFLECNMF